MLLTFDPFQTAIDQFGFVVKQFVKGPFRDAQLLGNLIHPYMPNPVLGDQLGRCTDHFFFNVLFHGRLLQVASATQGLIEIDNALNFIELVGNLG